MNKLTKDDVKHILFDSVMIALLSIAVVGSVKNIRNYTKNILELSEDLMETLKTE